MTAIILSIIALIINIFALFGIKNNTHKINRISRYITMFVIMCIQNFFIYYFLKYPSNLETYKEKVSCKDLYYKKCGKVTKKLEGIERYGKSQSEYYEEWLVIKFNDGTHERTKVNRDTYEKYSIGQGICFAEETDFIHTYHFFILLFALFSFVGIVIGIIYATMGDLNDM